MLAPEVAPAVDVRESLFTRLDQLAAEPSYMMQWAVLDNLPYWVDKDLDQAPMLLDYAARPGGSLLIRSYALDVGVGAAHRAVVRARNGGPPVAPALEEIYEQVGRVAPEYLDAKVRPTLNFVPHETEWLDVAYFWFFSQIAKAEGINPALVNPDPCDFGFDPTTLSTNAPVAASILLRRLIGGTHTLDINNLSPQVARDALELALDFRSDEYQRAVIDGDYPAVAEFGRLARFTGAGGFEHDAPIDALYQLPDPLRVEYARTFNQLYEAQAKLGDFFPGADVVEAARAAVANALFVVDRHVRNGMRTEDSLELRRAGTIAASFEGDVPIQLLAELTGYLEGGHARITNPNVKPEVAVHEDDFTIFDFPPEAEDDQLQVAHYIRERGGNTCNYRYEYGGRAPGVLASRDWRFDVGLRGSRRPHHKDSRTDKSFSIRLDRDVSDPADGSMRNPAAEDGVVSLDIGSLLGKGFGRDIAVLLALGNKYRSEAIGARAKLNHQTDKIDQSLGQARVFAAFAGARRRELLALAGYAPSPALRRDASAILAMSLESASS